MLEPPIVAIVLRKTPLDRKGVNASYKAVVRSETGDSAAIAKALPDREIGVEYLCAALGRALNLPIPAPMLLFDDEFGLMFGSEELPHPDLKQAGMSDAALGTLLVNWRKLPEASAFDEWIANPDRHGGNLLTDGFDFWLIDHDLALAQGLDIQASLSNLLLTLACAMASNDLKKHRLVKAFEPFILAANAQKIVADNAFFVADDMVEFLFERKRVLFTQLKKRTLNHDEIPGF